MAPETGAEELQELMRGVVRRDRAAFAALYDRTAPLFGIAMRILCQREEAEDVLQEAFSVAALWQPEASLEATGQLGPQPCPRITSQLGATT